MKSVQQSAVVIRVDRNYISYITCNEKYILVCWCGFKIPLLILNIFIISFVKRQDLKKSQIRRIKISFWLHSVTLPLNASYFPGVFPLCVITWPMLGSVRFNTPTTGDLGISRATTCCVSNAVYCTHGNSDLIEETALFQFQHSFTYRNSMLIFTPDFFPKTFL